MEAGNPTRQCKDQLLFHAALIFMYKHTAGEWQSWNLNPDASHSQILSLHYCVMSLLVLEVVLLIKSSHHDHPNQHSNFDTNTEAIGYEALEYLWCDSFVLFQSFNNQDEHTLTLGSC